MIARGRKQAARTTVFMFYLYIVMCVSPYISAYIYLCAIINIYVLELKRIMSHYTLGWHDQKNEHHEIGEYAEDAFEAARFAREDVPYLHEHPFSLEYIKEIK